MTYRGIFNNYIVNDVGIPQWIYTYIGIRKPNDAPSQAFISVRDKNGNICSAYFLDGSDDQYKPFRGFILLRNEEPKMYLNTLAETETKDFKYDPLLADSFDPRIKIKFICQ